jgi:twitching motility protein PilJ
MNTFSGLGLFILCTFMVCVTLLYYRLRSRFDRIFQRLFNQLPVLGQTLQAMEKMVSETQHGTEDLAITTTQQSHKIVEVTAAVGALCSAIDQVSSSASASVSVALESVTIAAEGGIVVRSTISGMERIQNQIQETSNYMRRLSDSSQEIGEIVSLIDGIADQTNILSLNAAIQAAMAGEAGRGFAVVADEIQRLSEKVSYATKEIGSLVRSIQTDTNQVIVAMDQTKTQVLEGVHSAQDAGSTLEKIETVSRRLSDLIQTIASKTRDQALVSDTISHIMQSINSLSEQTTSGRVATGYQIDQLKNVLKDFDRLMAELEQTRDSFK